MNARHRQLMIGAIIARDTSPPEKMNRRRYRTWLNTLSDDDLAEWSGVIRKTEKEKNER
jgi:hypothetical protein